MNARAPWYRSIGGQLLIGYLAVGLPIMGIVVTALVQMYELEMTLLELSHEEIPEAHAAWEIRSRLFELQTAAQEAVASAGEEEMVDRVRAADHAILTNVEVFVALHVGHHEVLVDELDVRSREVDIAITDMLRLLEQEGERAGHAALVSSVQPRIVDLAEALDMLFLQEDQEIAYVSETALARSNWGRKVITALLVAAAGISFVIAAASHRNVTRGVSALLDVTDAVAAGDLESRAVVRGDDELARLAVRFNDMVARLGQMIADRKGFFADISHELKTPLTAIRGEAEVALRGRKTDADYRDALENIDASATQLAVLVDELLFLARSEAGQMSYDISALGLSEVLASACARFRNVARFSEIDLLSALRDGVVVNGDRQRLAQLFHSIIDNAIKYSPAGSKVSIDMQVEDENVTVTVTDSGVGIDQAALPHIFERFFRADDAVAMGDGTGLGLAIAQSISRGHGGEIRVSSIRGEGTTVVVTLPCTVLSVGGEA